MSLMNKPIPLEADKLSCPGCGVSVYRIHGLLLERTAVHGLTEGFDSAGRILTYHQLPVYPAHVCA